MHRNHPMLEEKELVKNCLKGKLQAQKQLYDLYAPTMLGVCYRYTRSMTDAEDVLQEGFLKVYTKLSQFKFEGELGGWIHRIMVTSCLNFLKRNKRYRDEMFFVEEYMHPVEKEDPQVKMHAKELAGLVRQLPQGYQIIFNLHAVEGFSHVEIGQMLGITDSTSRSQYSRARTLLISWLNKLSIEQKKEEYAGK